MDAFFASVEQHDDPSLKGRPVVVGGRSKRGVVAAASYEAREFGIYSAMPMHEALRRCKDLVVVSHGRGRYEEVSAAIFRVFHRFTPLVEGLSLDEAFLDVTASLGLFGSGEEIARRIKDEIFEETGLRASAGVAENKFLAKLASDMEKPDGLVVVPVEGGAEFIAALPIKRMWGVGKVAGEKLSDGGFSTIGDLSRADPLRLKSLLGSWGETVSELARGIDIRPVIAERPAKSIGAEETFEEDIYTEDEVCAQLLRQTQRVARRLFAESRVGHVISIKIKYSDFSVQSRQRRLQDPLFDTDSIYQVACDLVKQMGNLGRGVRLVGVSVSELRVAGENPLLFTDPEMDKRERIEEVSGAISEKFGGTSITRATLLKIKKTVRES